MAGFDLLQQEYRRGPPVEPQVPKFDPTAVQLISHGTDTAVRALLGGIELAQRNRLEQEQMAQQAALTIEGQAIQRENNVLDYNSASANTKLMGERYKVLNDLDEVKRQLYQNKLDEAQKGIGLGMDYATSVGAYRQDFQDRAQQLGMYDGRVQSNPGMFAMAIDILGREFPGAVSATGIPNQLAEWRRMNDGQQLSVTLGGKPQFITPNQAIAYLKNPDTHDDVYDALLQQSTGGTDVETKRAPGIGNLWNLFGSTSTKRVPSDKLQALEDAAKKYHPELIQPRIPRGMPRTEKTFNKAVTTGTLDPTIKPQQGQGLPAPDLPDATPASSPASIVQDPSMNAEADYVKAQSKLHPDKADQLREIFVSKYPGQDAMLSE